MKEDDDTTAEEDFEYLDFLLTQLEAPSKEIWIHYMGKMFHLASLPEEIQNLAIHDTTRKRKMLFRLIDSPKKD